MAFIPGRSRVQRNRSAGKSHPKKEFRHAIDNPIWHIVRHDRHRGWLPVHACGTCAATSSLRVGDNARPGDDTVPDKKLDAAAAALKKVSVIKNKYDQQLAEAPAAEKERLEGEAGDAMAKAVIDQGLSIEEYTTILKVAQKNPVVRDKLLERMK